MNSHGIAFGLRLAATFVVSGLPVVSQDQVRTWGFGDAIDTEVFTTPVRKVTVGSALSSCFVLTFDGRILAFGHGQRGVTSPPLPPSGLVFQDVQAGGVPIGLLSNGQIAQWSPFSGGTNPSPPPQLPAGMSWLGFASAYSDSFALRSDGTIQAWGFGCCGLDQIPALAPGLVYRSVSASAWWGAALVSDGTVRLWGSLQHPNLLPVPALPPGVSYVSVQAGGLHVLALRSDGRLEAWGDNSLGECNVPALPPGTSYVKYSAGGNHNVALRSDGQWVAWGDNPEGECNIPAAPVGTYVEMHASVWFTVALRSDGYLESWGRYHTPAKLPAGTHYREVDAMYAHGAFVLRSDGQLMKVLAQDALAPTPTLASGLRYEAIRNGVNFSLGLVSDGTLRAWGTQTGNTWGQLVIPPLPPGLRYVAMDAGDQNAVALRSDGSAVAWGDNSWGQATVPPLPPGLTYTAVDAGGQNVLFLRSDGSIAMAGTGGGGVVNLPNQLPGTFYTEVACGRTKAAAIRSDGSLVSWGSGNPAAPALPPGTSYVEVECADSHVIARRSDGVAVTWDHGLQPYPAPGLPPGRSHLRIGAERRNFAVLVGSTSSYVGIGAGCAGSMPAARLVPRDTPQIGRTLPVLVTNLPAGAAIVAFGWRHLQPAVSLAGYGLPGCDVHVSVDAAVVVSGSGTHAYYELPVPYSPGLLGVQFYNQAIVVDPAAANPAGAVLSEAMAGIVGG